MECDRFGKGRTGELVLHGMFGSWARKEKKRRSLERKRESADNK